MRLANRHKRHPDINAHRALTTPLVGNQRLDYQAIPALDPGDQRFGIGKLWHRAWRDERRRLKPTHPCRYQAVRNLDFLLNRHKLRPALQAIAQANLRYGDSMAHDLEPLKT